MIRMSLTEIAGHLNCSTKDQGTMIEGVTIDSRKVRPGMLFAALRGNRADGHDHVAAAVAAGAAATLVERRVASPVPPLLVPDVLAAIGELARAWRARLEPTVIGITGSNGKTTTREMVSNILRREHGVLSTTGNFNNELGLPLTLFDLNESHDVAVLEMGASKSGDIAYLADIAQPGIGLVTNVGPAHLQGFGDEEGVARAKGELYAALPENGWAVINGDEPWRHLWAGMSGAGQCIYFGSGEDCDVRAQPDERGQLVRTPAGEFLLQLHLPGGHNLQNALAATAVCVAMEIAPETVRAGLEATAPVPGRLNLVHAAGGWTVIDDTYNANPASLYAALQVLARERGEAWLVLGDMMELGASSRKLHTEMGEAAQSLGVRRLYAIGEATTSTVDAFGAGARHFGDHEDLLEALWGDLKPGVTCLVKGSRSMGMERIVRAIANTRQIREAL